MLDIQIAPVYGRSMDEEQQKVEELKKERIQGDEKPGFGKGPLPSPLYFRSSVMSLNWKVWPEEWLA